MFDYATAHCTFSTTQFCTPPSAGHRVGYDASQFSREYKRLFGQPPMRDVERLREAARREAPSLRA